MIVCRVCSNKRTKNYLFMYDFKNDFNYQSLLSVKFSINDFNKDIIFDEFSCPTCTPVEA